MENNITVVTCYFNIKSKFTDETYKNWMKDFLSITMNIVIFTDTESFDYIQKCRENHINTKIIIMKLNEFVMYKYYDYFKYCKTIDPEYKIHTPDLYLVWAEKIFFIQKTKEANYFNSKWFFWCDIGCCRNNEINDILTFPSYNSIKDFDENKIIYHMINKPILNDEKFDENQIPIMYKNNNLKQTSKNVRLQGGFFGCHYYMVDNMVQLYVKEFELFKENKMFVGKDQHIMYSLFMKNKNKINLINANEIKYYNPWFAFLKKYS